MFPLPALGHANNKQTHNYGKPIFTLLQMRIINSKEINAISRLSGYKKLNACTCCSEIVAKRKHPITAFAKEKKKTEV